MLDWLKIKEELKSTDEEMLYRIRSNKVTPFDIVDYSLVIKELKENHNIRIGSKENIMFSILELNLFENEIIRDTVRKYNGCSNVVSLANNKVYINIVSSNLKSLDTVLLRLDINDNLTSLKQEVLDSLTKIIERDIKEFIVSSTLESHFNNIKNILKELEIEIIGTESCIIDNKFESIFTVIVYDKELQISISKDI